MEELISRGPDGLVADPVMHGDGRCRRLVRLAQGPRHFDLQRSDVRLGSLA